MIEREAEDAHEHHVGVEQVRGPEAVVVGNLHAKLIVVVENSRDKSNAVFIARELSFDGRIHHSVHLAKRNLEVEAYQVEAPEAARVAIIELIMFSVTPYLM